MRAAQQEREIQTGNRPGRTPAPKTQIHQNKHNATIKPRKPNTNIMYNTKIQLYKKRAVPNDTEHKSPGMKMATSTQSANPKITIEENKTKPTQLSYEIHLYNSCTQARARAGKRRHWRVTDVQKQQSHNTRQHKHAAPQCTIM